MALSQEDIDRYARQIIVPGIGARGQQRLCETTVGVFGRPPGRARLEVYLKAAGFRTADVTSEEVALLAAADPDAVPAGVPARPTAWYRVGRGRLRGGVAPTPRAALEAAGPALASVHGDSLSAALACVGACDAATTLVGLALGWIDAGHPAAWELPL
ncbi:MAG: hypothetical protein D6815_07510 [Candidatus Dadabacteria bacterium]|nr:MAG: hypothetical protein D6815_07510 [Candidatus Dadabacteria bacterium]